MTVELDIDVQAVATAWLEAFGAALARQDADSVTALFTSDGSWRDVLAVTGQLRSANDLEQMAALLREAWADPTARAFRLTGVTKVDRGKRYGADVVEVFFDFTTHVGAGAGILRMREADDSADGLRGWILFTALQSLDLELPKPPGHADALSPGLSDVRNWLDRRTEATEYANREPTVLVVGGGQHGLSIAARLTALNIDTLLVEQSPRIGDNWRKRYRALKLHNHIGANHLPILAFPSTWEPYTPKDKLATWFEFYAQVMELNTWTSTTFEHAAWDEHTHTWEATLVRDGATRVVQPQHIIMATGVSGIPNVPDLPGIEEFTGPVTHSSGFVEGRPFAGKRVLVVGSGTSGHDICQDLDRHGAAEITMMQRSPTTVISLEPGCLLSYALYTTGRPIDEADLINISGNYAVSKRWLPKHNAMVCELDRDLLDGLHRAGFETDLGEDDLGFVFKYRRRGGGYYIDIGGSRLIIEGRVKILQARDVEAFTEHGLRTTDGATREYDAVILATGYKGIQDGVRRLFGADIGDRVGPVWGINDEGEIRNVARRTPQENLWFMAGGFPEARIYSRYLAIQIQAAEAGIAL